MARRFTRGSGQGVRPPHAACPAPRTAPESPPRPAARRAWSPAASPPGPPAPPRPPRQSPVPPAPIAVQLARDTFRARLRGGIGMPARCPSLVAAADVARTARPTAEAPWFVRIGGACIPPARCDHPLRAGAAPTAGARPSLPPSPAPALARCKRLIPRRASSSLPQTTSARWFGGQESPTYPQSDAAAALFIHQRKTGQSHTHMQKHKSRVRLQTRTLAWQRI